MEMFDRYGGSPPCSATMCGECEGEGSGPVDGGSFDDFGEVRWEECSECDGTGKRRDMHPLLMAARETLYGFTRPFGFAWLAWRRYGWDAGTPAQGFRMVWRDNAHNRGSLLRAALAEVKP